MSLHSSHHPNRTIKPERRNGITLIEVTVSIVLVGTVLLVSLSASAGLLRRHNQKRIAGQSNQLASQLLDEISAMDFSDPTSLVFGLEPDEDAGDRGTFDDVDDYHLYTNSPPTYRDGTVIDGYAGWSVTVTVNPCDPSVTGITTTSATAASPLRAIKVNCTTPEGQLFAMSVLVSDVPNDISATTSFDKWQRTKLTFPGGYEIHVTAPLRNHPEPTGI